jgi:DNA mismatch repair ATPase MutL
VHSEALGSEVAATKSLLGGETLSTVVGSHRQSHGTTVTVRDLFQEWPVRRRTLKSGSQLARIKAYLFKISLVSFNVSFTLTDTSTRKVIWSVRQSSSLLERINEVRGPAMPPFVDVVHQKGPYRVRGALSFVNRGSMKLCSDLFVNKRPLPPTHPFVQLLSSVGPEATTANVQGRNAQGRLLLVDC